MNPIEQVVKALRDCADELASGVEDRYVATKDHPAMKWRYERDLEPVTVARAALAEIQRWSVMEGKADPSGGFWLTTDFPSDVPAILLVRKEES